MKNESRLFGEAGLRFSYRSGARDVLRQPEETRSRHGPGVELLSHGMSEQSDDVGEFMSDSLVDQLPEELSVRAGVFEQSLPATFSHVKDPTEVLA